MNTMGILYKLKFVNNLFYNLSNKWIQFQILPYKYVDNAELSICGLSMYADIYM